MSPRRDVIARRCGCIQKRHTPQKSYGGGLAAVKEVAVDGRRVRKSAEWPGLGGGEKLLAWLMRSRSGEGFVREGRGRGTETRQNGVSTKCAYTGAKRGTVQGAQKPLQQEQQGPSQTGEKIQMPKNFSKRPVSNLTWSTYRKQQLFLFLRVRKERKSRSRY